MALSFFKHDVHAARDKKCAKLIRERGWEGYGLYWGLLEFLYESKQCELEYDLPNLAWQFHCDEELLRAVVEEYELFQVAEGRLWSEGVKKRYEEYKTQSERRIEAGRRAGVASGEARRARKQKASVTEPIIPQQTPTATTEPTVGKENDDGKRESPPMVKDAVSETLADSDFVPLAYSEDDNLSTQIISAWNDLFNGTAQAYRGVFLDAASWKRASDSFQAGYTLDDLKSAFQSAKNDDFGWLLTSALKPDNVQRLLVKREKEKETNDRNTVFNAERCDPSNSWDLVDWAQYERRE